MFRRYQRDGVWGRVLDALWTLADGGGQICWEVSVDSTIARARARCDDEDIDWSISVHTRRGALGGFEIEHRDAATGEHTTTTEADHCTITSHLLDWISQR